jgi:hypothetical protein
MLLHIVELTGGYGYGTVYKILVTKDTAPEWVKVIISVGLEYVDLADVCKLFRENFQQAHDSNMSINEYIEQQRDHPYDIIDDALEEAKYSYEAKSTIQVIHVFAKYLKTVY